MNPSYSIYLKFGLREEGIDWLRLYGSEGR